MTVDPNRFNALFGAAVAAEKSEKLDLARQYYASLLKNCEGNHSARVELAQAKRFIQEHPSSQ